jgi:hypothetical protein
MQMWAQAKNLYSERAVAAKDIPVVLLLRTPTNADAEEQWTTNRRAVGIF